jgi:hypothetical protein
MTNTNLCKSPKKKDKICKGITNYKTRCKARASIGDYCITHWEKLKGGKKTRKAKNNNILLSERL